MNKKILLSIAFVSLTFFKQWAADHPVNGHSEFWSLKYTEVTQVEVHNISKSPSIVNNQNLTVLGLLAIGVRAFKLPVHYEKDYGRNTGANPMVSHGMYRATFYEDYFGVVFGTINRKLDKLEKKVVAGYFFKLLLSPIRDILDMYRDGLKPIANMELAGRQATYGSSKRKAKIPYMPCGIDPSSRPLHDVLADIKTFLDKNPIEVVTVTIEDVTNNLDDIAAEFVAAEIDSYAHAQDKTQSWPTFGELVTSGKRLVVFINTKDKDGKYPWLNYTKNYFWSSKYGFRTKKQLLADTHLPQNKRNFKRRHQAPHNTIFKLSHYLTKLFAGTPKAASKVNVEDVLKQHVKNIAVQAKSRPTLIGVDFVELPNKDVFDFVDHLNGVGKYKGKPLFSFA